MGLASRGGTLLQDLDLRRIPGVPGQNLDPGLNPGEFTSFTSSSSSQVRSLCHRGTEVKFSPILFPETTGDLWTLGIFGFRI